MNIITEYKNILNYIKTIDEEILILFHTRFFGDLIYTINRKPNNPELIFNLIKEFPLKYFKYIDLHLTIFFLKN